MRDICGGPEWCRKDPGHEGEHDRNYSPPLPSPSGRNIDLGLRRINLETNSIRSGPGPTNPTFPEAPNSMRLAGRSAELQHEVLIELIRFYPEGFTTEHLRQWMGGSSARNGVTHVINELEDQGWVELCPQRYLKSKRLRMNADDRGQDRRLPIWRLSYGAADYLEKQAVEQGQYLDDAEARARWCFWNITHA